jgi:peptidoglycan-N-acetylglucosamine deacetylase
MRPITQIFMKFSSQAFAFSLIGLALGSCSDKPAQSPVSENIASPATVTTPPDKTPTTPAKVVSPAAPVVSAPGAPQKNPDIKLPVTPPPAGKISFSHVPVSEPYIAITFDDGPSPQNTPRLLAMLRERNIKATFYLVGSNVDHYPDVVRQILAEGHEIGSHSYTHPNLSKMSDEGIREQLTKTRDAIARAAGVQPRTLRPPYGALNQRQREMVNREFGYPIILWQVDPNDWQRPGSAVVTSRILSATTPGSIILAHDIHAATVDAMPATLDGLLKKGFKFVTVSQLLAMQPAAAPATAPAAQATPNP